jgi:uncharacterized membrane protein
LTTTPHQPQNAGRKPVTGRTRDLVIFADKAIFKLAKHWLALVNLFWGLYVGLPLLAPVLMDAGWTTPATIIHTMYRPACHQLPTRSYFYGGPKVAYTPEELAAAGVDAGPLSRDIGNETVGWKMAICQRDVAIYGSLFVGGVLFALVRRRRSQWRMPFRYYLVFLVPMGVDGLLQLFGVYESNWLARTITGLLFGLGSVLFAYPYLQEGFTDVRQTINRKLHLE